MPQRIRQWRLLPRDDRLAVLAIMVALPAISLGLRVFGCMRMRRFVERASAPKQQRHANPEDVADGTRLARLAAIAGRHGPVETTCLRQSLLVYGLLRRRGATPELKLGVRRHDGSVEAHAWVEVAGRSLDATARDHLPFPDIRVNTDGQST